MHTHPNTQTYLKENNSNLTLQETGDSTRYKETNMGFTPPVAQETQHNSTPPPMIGYITNVHVHPTEAGDLYDFRFKYSLSDESPEISLSTRKKTIYDDYYRQLQATAGWQQLGANAPPPFVNAVIDSKGIGFEILQITILECLPYEDIEIEIDPRKNCSEAYQSGIDNYKLGQYEEAIANFDEAIRTDPDNTTGYHLYIFWWKGQAKYLLRQHEEAIADFDEAICLDPDNITGCHPYTYHWKGQAKYHLERYMEAITDFDEVIRLDPNNATTNLPYTYYWRGQAKYQIGRYADAIPDFDAAVHLDTNNTTGLLSYMYYWHGQAKCQIGRYADAISDFDEVIHLDPNNATTNLPYTYY